MAHQCKDGSEPSPQPWVRHRRQTPFTDWIGDATGGVVCTGFGESDADLLLHAHDLLDACMLVAATFTDDTKMADAYRAVFTALYNVRGVPYGG